MYKKDPEVLFKRSFGKSNDVVCFAMSAVNIKKGDQMFRYE